MTRKDLSLPEPTRARSARIAAFLALALFLSMGAPVQSSDSGYHLNPLPVQTRALMLDPLFTPTKLPDAFHMSPMILFPNDPLIPGDFDFDLTLGTFGTDFDKTEKSIGLEEDSEYGIYTNLAWRFGVFGGPVPIELVTQLPFFFHSGSFETALRDPLTGQFNQVGDVDEDFAVGKWTWGLRFHLLDESTFLPSLVFQPSVGLPVDDSLASDSVDFDLRLSAEKYFGRGLTGTLYGGLLFPGSGKEAITDLGVETDDSVPYVGLVSEVNVAQLLGDVDPGRFWVHFGGSWRDSVYDFGAVGPDYLEEEVKLTGGLSFDMGYWGRRIGCPQGMVGFMHNLYGGPEKGDTQLITRFNFPFHFHGINR